MPTTLPCSDHCCDDVCKLQSLKPRYPVSFLRSFVHHVLEPQKELQFSDSELCTLLRQSMNSKRASYWRPTSKKPKPASLLADDETNCGLSPATKKYRRIRRRNYNYNTVNSTRQVLQTMELPSSDSDSDYEYCTPRIVHQASAPAANVRWLYQQQEELSPVVEECRRWNEAVPCVTPLVGMPSTMVSRRWAQGNKPEVVFHGTAPGNVSSISRKGLLVGGTEGIKIRNGAAYGRGIYVSSDFNTARGYGSAVLICALFGGGGSDICRMWGIKVIPRKELLLPVACMRFKKKEKSNREIFRIVKSNTRKGDFKLAVAREKKAKGQERKRAQTEKRAQNEWVWSSEFA
eukprot:TRINITY_DN68128_c7_g11_i2.p1 TRINITY_DN68128_c7_g11~~TRINITY_DN68128_c7_g11_i2.p1  ORF type:complete len:358 (+),score=30.61 TRINITY_DN68128_c7_g11_i2:35-1075(+)